MNIEELVKKHLDANWYGEDSTGYDDVAEAIRAALTELSAAHAIELRAYEATVANQAERIRQLEAELERVRCASLAVCRRFDNFNSDVVSDHFGTVHPMKIQETRERLIASLRDLYEMAAAPAKEEECSSTRPHNCRNRLRDEGSAYPRSGCAHCKTGGLTGCPFEKKDSSHD